MPEFAARGSVWLRWASESEAGGWSSALPVFGGSYAECAVDAAIAANAPLAVKMRPAAENRLRQDHLHVRAAPVRRPVAQEFQLALAEQRRRSVMKDLDSFEAKRKKRKK